MRLKTLKTQDGTEYTIREIPASLLRKHTDMTTGAAQMDMLGLCVLDRDSKPLGARADDMIPMRHVEELVTGIAELSGFSEGKDDAPDTATPS